MEKTRRGTNFIRLISIRSLGEERRTGCLTAVSPKSHGVRWRGGVERGATYEISGGSVLTLLPTRDG